jgi:MFS family permease
MDNTEQILEKVGKWGRYQLMISLCVMLTYISLAFIIIVLPLMNKSPDFKYKQASEILIIEDKVTFCNNAFTSEPYDSIIDKIILDDSGAVINWAYDLKIVCNTREIIAIIGTVFFMSSIASNLALSKFADLYGRKKIFLVLNFISFLSLIQLLYLKHIIQLIIASFVIGISSINLAISSVIINENIERNYSGLIMGLTNSTFPFGGLVNLTFMYFFKNWYFYLVFIIIAFFLANVLGLLYMEESPKWQLANQHHKEFLSTVQSIAEINKSGEILLNNETLYTKLKRSNNKHEKLGEKNEDYRKHVYEWYDLLKYPSLRLLTLKNIYLWIFTGFSFFGILLNLEGLTGNVYVDGIVSYSAEMIAEIGSGAILHYLGRRNTALYSFVLAAISSCLFTFINISWLKIILLFTSAIGIASGFNVLYVYSPELFPTNVKSLSISVFSLFNRLAASTIPILLTYTSNITLIIGVLSIIASGVAFTLPETLDYNPGNEIKEFKESMYDKKDEQESTTNGNYLYFHDVFE